MKNTLFAFSTLLLLASCGGFKEGANFRVKGRIGEMGAPAKVYFSYMNDGERLDSAVLENGRFIFTGLTEGPSAARLVLDLTGEGMDKAIWGGTGVTYLFYIEEGTIVLASQDSLRTVDYGKSPINEHYHAYLAAIGGPIQELSARMNRKFAEASPAEQQDTAFMAALNQEFHSLLSERAEAQYKYAQEHPDSYFSVVALSEAAGAATKMDVERLEPLFLAVGQKWREGPEGRAFAQRIQAARTIGIGKTAPDFTQDTPDGRAVSLSDFRGKYVLLDFWASWCGPCRAENPTVLKAYALYHEKGFDVLGVSLDKQAEKEAWVRAIEKDGLVWTNIADLKGWSNAAATMYGIRAVPQNYLIDPQGVIVAQNLRGEALLEFLAGLFGGK